MAITPLSSDVKKLTFDGETSASYGVRILGTGVFNAPQRATRAITVPGRNGSVMMDLGRFENIDVTYPANLVADNPEDFAAAMSEFRNFLCSKKGYCRLEDDYNPGEYRLAMYKGGLEVSEKVLKAGEFNITFTCKPQRFLTSGETEVTVTRGDTITNPTPFDSQPLLAVKGEGTVTVNGYAIRLIHQDLGNVSLFGQKKATALQPTIHNVTVGNNTYTKFPNTLINVGDEITIKGLTVTFAFTDVRLATVIAGTGIDNVTITGGAKSGIELAFPEITVGYKDNTSASYTARLNVQQNAMSDFVRYDFTVTVSAPAFGNDNGTVRATLVITPPSPNPQYVTQKSIGWTQVTAYATSNGLGDPTYIDCEIGEAYMVRGGEIVSLNSNIDLGSDVPTLKPGENAVSFGSTITEVKIVPRWWKI